MIKSLIFVPAIAKRLAKIPSIKADAYIVDLEDSISADKKENALKEAVSFLEVHHEQIIYLRLDNELIDKQIEALSRYKFEGYMLPKFEDPECFRRFEAEISLRNNIALVETPKGLINLREIASCEWITAIAFGAEDYTASVMMENLSVYLSNIKSQIVMFARAFGKSCYDTPYMSVDNDGGLLSEVNISADMGFDGKLAVHPRQIMIINEVFSRRNNTDFMKYVVRCYEENGGGAVNIEGKIYERMHIARFKKILEQEDFQNVPLR